MAITINGTGSITGLTAGGLPDGSVTNADLEYAGTDGQVLTSTGATTAPAWEDLPAGVDGFSWLTGQSLSGNALVTFTGIPTTANIIKIGFAEVGATGSTSGGQMNVRLGNGSINTANNYRYGVSYGNTIQESDGTSRWALIHDAFTANNALFNGTLELIRIPSANWWCSSWAFSDHGGNNATNVGGGFYNGSSGLIDRIQIYNGSTTFGNGNVVVGYA